MSNNPSDGSSEDFFEQMLGFPTYAAAAADPNLAGTPSASPMMLQLGSGDGSAHLGGFRIGMGLGGIGAPFHVGGAGGPFPLGLSLEQGRGEFMKMNDVSGNSLKMDCRPSSSMKPGYHGQLMPSSVPAMPHPPTVRPRVRARRGQATDPHSIAERLRRERIAERIRALQELVPSVNKTDRAVMLDEIVEYVKFLRLQVKVLSMSRLGGAGAVAPLVTDMPISLLEEEGGGEAGKSQPAWEKWSSDGTERQVAKLMEENVGAAMQFLQSKALCIMPISLASAIYHSLPPDTSTFLKPETHPHS
ncbi:unnamed protein product [Cuscuta campestris]|uniref:BHLH domain-containing protein n=2 Tax=Cuscuta sect. Cleistogrammica TaxID=1824901 RepID=A0A484MDG0_9ASTE|nr:hypothetical protein DM860_011948 [Cuscuta australis]VFQ86224.1 unnamed protein product [Cuscuta campestris]